MTAAEKVDLWAEETAVWKADYLVDLKVVLMAVMMAAVRVAQTAE